MSAPNDGGPAFPTLGESLRDGFAWRAIEVAYQAVQTGTPEAIAGHAYAIADAMLAERAREAAPDLLVACKGALAALTQPKTFPADVEAAKAFLAAAIAKAGAR